MLLSNVEKMGKNIKLKNNVYLDSSNIKASGGQSIFKTEFRSIIVSENANVGDIIQGQIADNPPNGYKVLCVVPDWASNSDRNIPIYNHDHYANRVSFKIEVAYRPVNGILYVGFTYIYIHSSLVENITT